MDDNSQPDNPVIKPFYVPPGIKYEDLSPAVQLAFRQLIEPAYCDLVVGARNGLERSAGNTVVFLLMQEIFNQFELAREFDYGQNQEADKARAEQREKLLARHLKLVNSKTQAAQFMLKIRAALAKQGLLHLPPTLG